MGEQCMCEQSQSHRCRVAAVTWGKLQFKAPACIGQAGQLVFRNQFLTHGVVILQRFDWSLLERVISCVLVREWKTGSSDLSTAVYLPVW